MRQKKDVPDIREVIRRRVRELRDERGWSGQQLVDTMHRYGAATTRSTLSNYENGARAEITFSEAIAMALALDMPLSYLVGDSEAAMAGEAEPAGPIRVGEKILETRDLVRLLGGRQSRPITVTVGLSAEQAAQLFPERRQG
jgi:transcriptional regulator with XRE-family HTH domain